MLFSEVMDPNQYRPEDIPFLEHCWQLVTSILEKNAHAEHRVGLFCPVFEADGVVNEVTVDWEFAGSSLKVMLARQPSMVHNEASKRQFKFTPYVPAKLRAHLRNMKFVAPEIIQQMEHLMDTFLSMGYSSHAEAGSKYPIPNLIFDNPALPITSIGMMQFTPVESYIKPTLH